MFMPVSARSVSIATDDINDWKNLQIPTVKHEISRYSYHYSKHLSVHPNELI
jgi:hypothetical protein